MNQFLQKAIKEGKAKEYYGAFLIYPRKFLESWFLDRLLLELKQDHEFVNIMGTIKAIPKRREV